MCLLAIKKLQNMRQNYRKPKIYWLLDFLFFFFPKRALVLCGGGWLYLDSSAQRLLTDCRTWCRAVFRSHVALRGKQQHSWGRLLMALCTIKHGQRQGRGGTEQRRHRHVCHLALVQPFLEGWAINFSPPSPPADCASCQGKLKPAEYSFLCRHTFWLWSWRNISLAMGNLSQHCSCPCVSTSIGKD